MSHKIFLYCDAPVPDAITGVSTCPRRSINTGTEHQSVQSLRAWLTKHFSWQTEQVILPNGEPETRDYCPIHADPSSRTPRQRPHTATATNAERP